MCASVRACIKLIYVLSERCKLYSVQQIWKKENDAQSMAMKFQFNAASNEMLCAPVKREAESTSESGSTDAQMLASK